VSCPRYEREIDCVGDAQPSVATPPAESFPLGVNETIEVYCFDASPSLDAGAVVNDAGEDAGAIVEDASEDARAIPHDAGVIPEAGSAQGD
jgi:hypothetical protein